MKSLRSIGYRRWTGHALSPMQAAGLLFVAFLGLRWVSRSKYLINWDSVQFALGVESFNLATHQPHPPGYIGYMFLGRTLAPLLGDVPAALTLISVVSGAVAPAVLFLLARRMLPDRYALASAVLFGLSPLLWHYSGVALTYAPEVALSLTFAFFIHRAREEHRLGDLLAAATAFAVLGSVRQSALILLSPLWLLGILPFRLRTQVYVTGLLGAACLAWTVPLISASGGLLVYMREAAALADLAVARTAFMTAAFTGLLQNVGILALGLLIGMHATLFVLWPARRRQGGSFGALRQTDRRFLLAWAFVPMFFFVLIHTGQPGYALLLMPIGHLWVGSALAQLIEQPRPASAPPHALVGHRRPRLSVIFGVLSVSGVVGFFALPSLTYRAAASEVMAEVQSQAGLPSPADRSADHVDEVPSQSPLALALRQYSIPRHDAHWASLMDFIQRYASDQSVVLTGIGGPIISGSFRQLGYYLPEYRVYAVGWDRSGEFGYLFRSFNRESTYTVAGLKTSSNVLILPTGVRWIVIPDADVAALLDPAIVQSKHKLENGVTVTVAHVKGGKSLSFESVENEAKIELR